MNLKLLNLMGVPSKFTKIKNKVLAININKNLFCNLKTCEHLHEQE